MSALGHIHTFLRRALQELPWDGPAFGAMFGYLSGILPDSLAEGHRSVARMLVPLPYTPVDVLPHLLRAFGLPAYQVHDTSVSAGYLAVLARCRAAWDTHAIGGSNAGMAAELESAGLADVRVHRGWEDSTISEFRIETSSATLSDEYGAGGDWGDGDHYGVWDLTESQAQGLRAVLAYWRPARSRFIGIHPVGAFVPLGSGMTLPFRLGAVL